MVNFGWLPWTTAKTVYPRSRNGVMYADTLDARLVREPPAADAEDDALAVGLLLRREDVHRQREAVLAAVDDVLGSGVIRVLCDSRCGERER